MASFRSVAFGGLYLWLSVLGHGADAAAVRVRIVAIADAPTSCGDARSVVARALGRGRVKLNAEPEEGLDEAVSRIHEVMVQRADKVLYVTADSGVAWGELLALVSRVWNEAEVISIVTPTVDQLARTRRCLVPSRRPYGQVPRHALSDGAVRGEVPQRIRLAFPLWKVAPVYPESAKKRGVEGAVRLDATIDQDGHVKAIQPISGDTLLVDSARDAVMEWVYRPTLLNGVAIEVITEVCVPFVLSKRTPRPCAVRRVR